MAKAAAAKAEPYGVHPPIAKVQKWVGERKEKTGRSVEEWVALVKKEGPEGFKPRVEWLNKRHKVGNNAAWWIVERAEGKGDEDTREGYRKAAVVYADQQYAGPKEKFGPIYRRLLELGKLIGDDVKACRCKTVVPLYRKHAFAQIKPTTNTRIDLGFALTGHQGELPQRLIDTG